MPRRKINRTLEEEEQFQQQRLERKRENQRRRHEIAQTATIQTTVCMTGTIYNNSTIELNNDIVGENSANNILLNQQCIEYQLHFRSRRIRHSCLNVSSTTPINEIVEYYIGSMDIVCSHCNAKHFVAEKVSNKGTSFHDCCSHGAVSGIITSTSTISL